MVVIRQWQAGLSPKHWWDPEPEGSAELEPAAGPSLEEPASRPEAVPSLLRSKGPEVPSLEALALLQPLAAPHVLCILLLSRFQSTFFGCDFFELLCQQKSLFLLCFCFCPRLQSAFLSCEVGEVRLQEALLLLGEGFFGLLVFSLDNLPIVVVVGLGRRRRRQAGGWRRPSGHMRVRSKRVSGPTAFAARLLLLFLLLLSLVLFPNKGHTFCWCLWLKRSLRRGDVTVFALCPSAKDPRLSAIFFRRFGKFDCGL